MWPITVAVPMRAGSLKLVIGYSAIESNFTLQANGMPFLLIPKSEDVSGQRK